MGTFLAVLILVALLYVALDAFVVVPGAHYGVHLRFGKRTGRIYKEGLGLKIPFIDQVELFSTELDKIEVNVTFTSKDKLQLILNGSLQYRPDPRLSDGEGRNTFFAMSEQIVKDGIEDAIQALLGGLGGVYEGEKFIESRQALGSLINAILRLDIPPHLRHDTRTCGVQGCNLPEKIDAPQLIEYYNDHWREVKRNIDEESQHPDSYSVFENRYGIDIETFALAVVDFSEETKRAFEKEKQAEASKRAFQHKLGMAGEVRRALPDATAQQVLNAADVSLDPNIKKQVISVEGDAGVLGGFLGNLSRKGGQDA